MYHHWRVVASYQASCFCEKPKLPLGDAWPDNKRVPWKHLLETYAQAHGMRPISYKPLNSGGGACMTCETDIDCQHQKGLYVRLEVVPVRE